MVGIPFTSANAAEMAAKAHESRRLHAEALRNSLEAARNPSEDFRADALKSVRAQMRLILGRIDKELEKAVLDTKVLRELGATVTKFEAMEQKLSMRAGPGSLKPAAPKSPKTGNFAPPPPADDVSTG